MPRLLSLTSVSIPTSVAAVPARLLIPPPSPYRRGVDHLLTRGSHDHRREPLWLDSSARLAALHPRAPLAPRAPVGSIYRERIGR